MATVFFALAFALAALHHPASARGGNGVALFSPEVDDEMGKL
jgi:hypothetical protein